MKFKAEITIEVSKGTDYLPLTSEAQSDELAFIVQEAIESYVNFDPDISVEEVECRKVED